MPPTREPAAALLDALSGLPLLVEEAACSLSEADVPSYPGGRRPTAMVTLAGDGAQGAGEHVAWTTAEHVALRDALTTVVPRGRWRLGEWAAETARRAPAPYARAALEAAAIDLALRQQGTNVFRLTGLAPRPVRYVVSFGRCDDPVAEAQRLMAEGPGIGIKVDADPAWDDRVYQALAGLGSVTILDFKDSGTVLDHERAHRALPDALIEEPRAGTGAWSASLRGRISVDGAVRRAADVDALPLRPAAINVKPARMGGVLEALRGVAACAEAGIGVYFGGMFEVAVGRLQLHALAALCAPEAPNDIAPMVVGRTRVVRPSLLVVDAGAPGFA